MDIKYSKRKYRMGFSLVEVMVSLSIGLVVITVAYSLYSTYQNYYKQSSIIREISQNGRVSFDRMIRDIRQASEIVTNLDTPQTLILFQDGHTDPSIPPQQIIQYIEYGQENNSLVRKKIVYSFDFQANPVEYVYWDDLDQNNQLPSSQTIENQVVSEYLTFFEFSGSPVISVQATYSKEDKDVNFNTKVLSRNAN